jgi:acetyltransferase-like isoleucine patch superfamily enzyme
MPNLDRLRRAIARRRDADDPRALDGWGAPELAGLGWLLGRRLARGTLLRARLGHAAGRVFCERGVRVLHARHVHAGRDLNLEEGCQIMGLSRRGIVFGDRCTVGRGAMISPTGILGGEPGDGLRMGDNANIGHYAIIGCSGFIEIGARVLMGPHVCLIAENHVIDDPDLTLKEQGVERAPIVIEDDVWLGSGAIVVAGVTVGRGSVVAAGAVVTEDVRPGSIVAGVPARLVRSRGERLAAAPDGSAS